MKINVKIAYKNEVKQNCVNRKDWASHQPSFIINRE
jgi:hypothetical protein